MRCDVLVVGAGPAGAAAAVTAANRGRHVILVDKAGFPRDKTCGDGLTAGALRGFETLGLDVRAVPTYEPIRETVIVSPSGRRVTLPLPPDAEYAGVVPRLDLDAALVDVARNCGVEVRERAEVTGLGERDDGITATVTDGDEIRASTVIAADGHYSSVRRLRGSLPPDLGKWHAFRQYYRNVDERRLWVLFEQDLLPGYAWMFPLPDGRANVGFGLERRRGIDGHKIRAAWRNLLARPTLRDALGDRAEPESSHRAWPIPAWDGRLPLTDGRVLYVGDAAAVVDPMTGEGIAQALDTGMLAAEAHAAGGGPAAVAARYRSAVRHQLRSDFVLARLLSTVLRSPFRTRAALRVIDANDWCRRNFARWMFEDYPRAILATPRRWRPGMLAAAGAYR
ncbi:MAG: geranylgeranyl reductase family protein [Acidimicrobiia bacterium]